MNPGTPTDLMADAHVPSSLTVPIQRPRHIPSLDGLRALSVVLVILLHTLQRRSETHFEGLLPRVFTNGALGVFVFFVISGYLITSLLLREQEKTGHISLKSFYVRRAFRILPPLYVYIGFIGILGLTGHMPGMNLTEFFNALAFTRNYSTHVSLWAFEHFWSLCIEEQFYLIWPGTILLCLLHRDKLAGRRAAARIALGVIVAEPFIRLFCFHFLPRFRNMGSFHMQADALMFGVMGALLQGRPRFEAIYNRVTRWPWLVPVVLFFVSGTLGLRYGNYWYLPIGITLNGLLVLAWMLWLVRNPDTLQGRIFNQPAVAWLGRLSYSLYIWQTFFIHHDNLQVAGHLTWWNTWPGNWICIFLVAVFSFYVIEQPSLRLRDVFLRKLHWHET